MNSFEKSSEIILLASTAELDRRKHDKMVLRRVIDEAEVLVVLASDGWDEESSNRTLIGASMMLPDEIQEGINVFLQGVDGCETFIATTEY